MRWSPEPLSIGPRDGFDKSDIFGFKPFGERLANFVASVEDDPVLLLDGPWGSGKTTFITQWEGLLRQRGHAVLHLDAFVADHYGEPFLPLTEGVHRVATEDGLCLDTGLVDQFERIAAEVAKELCWSHLALAFPGLGSLFGSVKTAIASSRESAGMFRGWLEGAADRREAIQKFRASLEKLADHCARQASASVKNTESPSAEGPVRSSGGTRFVFVVDELDRCRPRFAVAMLERIKHIFGVDGVTFVLVANVEELSKSVEREYGRIDSKRYLEKFYDLRVQMPEKTRRSRSWTGQRYIEYLIASHSRLSCDDTACRQLREVLGGVAASRGLSLRSAEHIFRNALVLSASDDSQYRSYPRFVGVVSAVRVLEPTVFNTLVERAQCEDSEVEVLAELLDPTGSDRERAQAQVEANLGEFAALSVLARALDGFDV